MVMLLIVLVVIDVLAGDGVVLVKSSRWCQKLVVVKVVIMLFLNNFLLSAGGDRPRIVDLMVDMRVMERIYIAKEEFRMSFLSSLVPPPSVVEPVQL